MLDVGSKLPFIGWHNDGADPHKQVGSSTSGGYVRDLTEFWIPYFGKPLLIRTDPEGAFLSKESKRFCCEYRMEASVQPGEAHWRMANVERAIGIIKDALTRLDVVSGTCLPCVQCLLGHGVSSRSISIRVDVGQATRRLLERGV